MPRRPSTAWPWVLGFAMVGACTTAPTTGGGGPRRSPTPGPALPSPSLGQDLAATGASPGPASSPQASPDPSATPVAIASPAASASASPAALASPAATASAQPRITFPLRLSPAIGLSLVGATNAALLQDSNKVATLGSVVQLDEQGRLLANNAGSLIGNHSGGLISDHGGGLIGNHSGGLIGNHSGGYRLAQAQPTPRPDFDATGIAQSFTLAKDYTLAIVDLTAFVDQAMLAWAKASPSLGRWQAFSYTATTRVASGGLELFPAMYSGQKMDMHALARLQGDTLEVAFFYGHPDLGLQWLLVQAKRDGSSVYTYDAGTMTNHLIRTRSPNHPVRLALNGRFQALLAGGRLDGQEDQGFFQVADPAATSGTYLVGREDGWRVTPENGSILIAAGRHLLGPLGSRYPSYEGGRTATRLFPDGRGLFWAAYADGSVEDAAAARFLFVDPQGKHSELTAPPPAWYFDAEGKQVAQLEDLTPKLPGAGAFDGVARPVQGGLSLGVSRHPFAWQPKSADAPF